VTFYRLAGLAVDLDRREAGLRLLATTYTIDRHLGHPDAEATDLPAIHQAAEALGLDKAELDALLAEVEEAYRQDRGRRLVAAALPELHVDA